MARVIRTWCSNWLVSYDFAKSFNDIDRNILVQKLRKYVDDKRLMGQIIKILKTQVTHIVTVPHNGILMLLQNNLSLLLFFNFYLHSFDKFVEKIVKNVSRIENTT